MVLRLWRLGGRHLARSRRWSGSTGCCLRVDNPRRRRRSHRSWAPPRPQGTGCHFESHWPFWRTSLYRAAIRTECTVVLQLARRMWRSHLCECLLFVHPADCHAHPSGRADACGYPIDNLGCSRIAHRNPVDRGSAAHPHVERCDESIRRRSCLRVCRVSMGVTWAHPHAPPIAGRFA